MILIDTERNIYTDNVDEEISEGMRDSLMKSGATLCRHGTTLYRFNSDGSLVAYDITQTPFFKLTLNTWERDAFKKRGEYSGECGHVMYQSGTDFLVHRDGRTGVFPLELMDRW